MTTTNNQEEQYRLATEALEVACDPTTGPTRLIELTDYDDPLVRFAAWTNPNLASHEECDDERGCLADELNASWVGCHHDVVNVLLDCDEFGGFYVPRKDGSSQSIQSMAMRSAQPGVRGIACVYAWDYLSEEDRLLALADDDTVEAMTTECESILGDGYEGFDSIEDLLDFTEDVRQQWSEFYRDDHVSSYDSVVDMYHWFFFESHEEEEEDNEGVHHLREVLTVAGGFLAGAVTTGVAIHIASRLRGR